MSIVNYAKFIISSLNANLKIKFDKTKPNGTPRKIVDNTIAKKYGWKPKLNLKRFKNDIQRFSKSNLIMRKYIVITGGAGFVGSNLIHLLIKKTKFNIISIDNYSTGLKKSYS